MYGQKQILQCMAVAIVLAIFNFHRQAIKHNREVSKHKLIIKRETNLKDRPSDMEKTTITSTTAAMTDYCVRYPFGGNIYENYQSDCQPICVKSIESWMKQQCEINCCIERMANITIGTPHKTLTQRGQTLKTNRMLKTRNCEKKPITIFDENGASLHNQPFESVKTIIEPINEKFMSYVQNEEEHQCKIRTDVEFICKNTSAHTVDFVKLDTNKTKIMEYNDFLFDMGATIPRKAEAQSLDRKSVFYFFFFSFFPNLFFVCHFLQNFWYIFFFE